MRRLPVNVLALLIAATVFMLSGAIPLLAQTEGQKDLDAATSLKLNASSMADLERVIELCDSAIEKGLDEESEKFAKSLITATLFQHGSRFAQALFDPRERTQRPAMLKQFALRDLMRILKYDDSIAQVHLMIARLEAVDATGQGIRPEAFQRGKASADRAVELLAADKPMLSKALVLRAGFQRGAEQMADINRAIEVDPKNADAWRLRGKSRLVQGEFLAAAGQLEAAKRIREQAVEDFTTLLTDNPDDVDALQAVAELLGRLGNYEEALEKANQAVEQNPESSSLYRMRARLFRMQSNFDKAIRDLNQAIDIRPDSYLAYLDRCGVHYDHGDKNTAAKDYGRARELEPNLAQAVLQGITMRAEGKYDKAISELQRFLEIDELNALADSRVPDPDYRLQLGATYVVTKKPTNAIDVLTVLINSLGEKPRNSRARNARLISLHRRADAYLSIGKQAEAILDYEIAYKTNPNDDSILNNLAWVLATSPRGDLRDAKRAIELATKACRVTNYKQAHILSTLAAAYAESGDFEKAIEWSAKAVELGKKDIAPETQDQLKKELESYHQQKPWRELQDVTKEQDEVNGPAEQQDQNNDTEKETKDESEEAKDSAEASSDSSVTDEPLE